MSDHTELFQALTKKLSENIEARSLIVSAHDGTDMDVYLAPKDIGATDLQAIADKYASRPRHRAGKLQAFDLASFASLTLRDYDAGSVVFADVSGEGVTFETCLDYHYAAANLQGSEQPGWDYLQDRRGQRAQRETIVYKPALSKEWLAWTKQAGQKMTQAEFAAWIDDHLPDIADPRALLSLPSSTAVKLGEVYGFGKETLWGYADPSKLVEVSEGLAIREGAVVKNAVNLASGEVAFTYQTEHTGADGKSLNVPKRFLLAISVFEREAIYYVPVRLVYRKQGSAIVWSFELYRPERFLDDAIKGMVGELAHKLTPTPSQATQRPDSDAPPVIAPVVPIHLARRMS